MRPPYTRLRAASISVNLDSFLDAVARSPGSSLGDKSQSPYISPSAIGSGISYSKELDGRSGRGLDLRYYPALSGVGRARTGGFLGSYIRVRATIGLPPGQMAYRAVRCPFLVINDLLAVRCLSDILHQRGRWLLLCPRLGFHQLLRELRFFPPLQE